MTIRQVLSKIGRIIYSIIGLTAFGVFVAFPFLNNSINHLFAQIAWYLSTAFMIIHSIFRKDRNENANLISFIGDRSFLLIIILMTSALVINYYDTNYDWYWAIFILVGIGIPNTAINLMVFSNKTMKPTNEQLKIGYSNLSKIIIYWWIIDLLFISSVKEWVSSIFIFGGLAMLMVFYNLTFSFLSDKKRNKVFLLQDFIVGIGITIYLIYMIPDEKIQMIVLTIISAVYGGMITLIGIAWTIKENNKSIRLNHINQIKPLFYPIKYSNVNHMNNSTIQVWFVPNIEKRTGDHQIIGAFKNSDKSEFIIDRLVIDDVDYLPESVSVVEKGKITEVLIFAESYTESSHEALLYIYDVEGNKYKYIVTYEHNISVNEILKIQEVVTNE
ncbi:MAG: hypothetical protein C4543_09625 [Ignavibacteriales bacterium]|jgi:hypothetical protein|nr:MAG: hypothetical protein C4543_09625 [Ignavibacteriales bacterium]